MLGGIGRDWFAVSKSTYDDRSSDRMPNPEGWTQKRQELLCNRAPVKERIDKSGKNLRIQLLLIKKNRFPPERFSRRVPFCGSIQHVIIFSSPSSPGAQAAVPAPVIRYWEFENEANSFI